MKNKKLIILVSLLTAFAILFGAFFLQVYRGVFITQFSYLIQDIEQDELDEYIELCSPPGNEAFIYFDNINRFPSENAEDYKRIVLYADISNFSILHYMRTNCFMHDYLKNSNFCFAIPGDAVYYKIERFSRKAKIPIGTLLIYSADLDENEIHNCIKNLFVDNYFTNNLCGNIKYRSNLKSENLIALSENPFS
ncbi:MAG: hypothetical protein J1E05_07240 [Eubacterium sp.]|nr:hypothetical protein [Eubacterium sp.]